MRAAEFSYDLPEMSIAQSAVEPRHSSRLLDTRDLSDHTFIDLPSLLLPGDLVVVNDTRVRAARLHGKRADTGGKVELLVLDPTGDGSWRCLARPARRLRPGVSLIFSGVTASVVANEGRGVVLVDFEGEDDEAAIATSGEVPLPPYFRGALMTDERYQTVFARVPGSSAAPTAGLHFTSEVIQRLADAGVELAAIDLHVSLDTFRPMTTQTVEDHVIHREWCAVSRSTQLAIQSCRESGGRVVAVGTTVVRTLETANDGAGGVRTGDWSTNLFIKPGFEFGVVDLLVTNFHMPGSTLLVLLAAFMGDAWRSSYEAALARGYRFLSFGDAMLAERGPTRSLGPTG